MAHAKKLRDFPLGLLEALDRTLEEKCPLPESTKPILTDADRWEMARQQGRRSVLADVRAAMTTMRKRGKRPPPIAEEAE